MRNPVPGRRLGLLVGFLLSGQALADRGALTVDVAGGLTATPVLAPDTTVPKSTTSLAAAVWLGGRYALTHQLEFSAAAFFEPPVTLFHNGVTVQQGGALFPGTLTHSMVRYGAQAGARYVLGMVWRVHLGLEAGFSYRGYSKLQHIDDTNPAAPVDYGLTLADTSRTNAMLSPVVGLEWAAGDHWSIAVMPRVQLLVGADSTFAVTVPVQLSWSWY